MADISKCTDHQCPSKDFCYRFTAPISEYRQAYGSFGREEDAYNCDMFWHNGVCKHCHQSDGNHKMSCPTTKIQVNL
jgi:hypothetical protein